MLAASSGGRMVAVVTGGEWGDEEGPVCRLRRNEAGIVTWADEAVADVLGWRPEQVIGSPSTTFIHPEDQASAVSAWFEMLAKPDATASWRGRYRTAGGEWQWVRSVNTNRLDDPLLPCVETTMCASPWSRSAWPKSSVPDVSC